MADFGVISGALETVKQNFEKLKQDETNMSVKAAQLQASAPPGFVMDFGKSTFGGLNAQLRFVGVQDPRIQAQLQQQRAELGQRLLIAQQQGQQDAVARAQDREFAVSLKAAENFDRQFDAISQNTTLGTTEKRNLFRTLANSAQRLSPQFRQDRLDLLQSALGEFGPGAGEALAAGGGSLDAQGQEGTEAPTPEQADPLTELESLFNDRATAEVAFGKLGESAAQDVRARLSESGIPETDFAGSPALQRQVLAKLGVDPRDIRQAELEQVKQLDDFVQEQVSTDRVAQIVERDTFQRISQALGPDGPVQFQQPTDEDGDPIPGAAGVLTFDAQQFSGEIQEDEDATDVGAVVQGFLDTILRQFEGPAGIQIARRTFVNHPEMERVVTRRLAEFGGRIVGNRVVLEPEFFGVIDGKQVVAASNPDIIARNLQSSQRGDVRKSLTAGERQSVQGIQRLVELLKLMTGEDIVQIDIIPKATDGELPTQERQVDFVRGRSGRIPRTAGTTSGVLTKFLRF